MGKLKLVSGANRHATVADLAPGDVFEYQGDIFMMVEQDGAMATMLEPGTRLLVNLSTFKTGSLHMGSEVYQVDAELVLK